MAFYGSCTFGLNLLCSQKGNKQTKAKLKKVHLILRTVLSWYVNNQVLQNFLFFFFFASSEKDRKLLRLTHGHAIISFYKSFFFENTDLNKKKKLKRVIIVLEMHL